jgi:hypothetical protein
VKPGAVYACHPPLLAEELPAGRGRQPVDHYARPHQQAGQDPEAAVVLDWSLLLADGVEERLTHLGVDSR